MAEKDQDKNQQNTQATSTDPQKQRNSAFNEPNRGDEKSTINVEEEAQSEQERKEAMTERD